jgi:hypothetical protein
VTEINDTAVYSNRNNNLFEMNKEAIKNAYPITFSLHKGIFIGFFIIGISFGILGLANIFITNRIEGFIHAFIGITYIFLSISFLRSRIWLTKKGLFFKHGGIKGFIPYENIKNVKVSYEKWKIRNFFREYIAITGRMSFDSVRRMVRLDLNEPQKFYNLFFRTRKKSIVLIELPIPEQLFNCLVRSASLNGYNIQERNLSTDFYVNVWNDGVVPLEERSEFIPQFD